MNDSFPSSEELDKAANDYQAGARILGKCNAEELGEAFFDGAMWMFRNRPQTSKTHPKETPRSCGNARRDN